jgi:hypothetical protein
MATEYDLLRSLLSRSETHNQQPRRRFDKHIRIRKLLSSLRCLCAVGGAASSDDQRYHRRSTQMSRSPLARGLRRVLPAPPGLESPSRPDRRGA